MKNQLHLATYQSNVKEVRLLLFQGACPNERDACNNTPLHYAERASHDVLMLLVRAGADPHAVNDAGLTPIDIMLEENGGQLLGEVTALVNEERLEILLPTMKAQVLTCARRF